MKTIEVRELKDTLLEQQILGTILLDNKSIKHILELTEDYFQENLHKQIFTQVMKYNKQRQEFDITDIVKDLATDELPQQELINYMVKLTESVITKFDLPRKVTQLKEIYKKIQLQKIAEQCIESDKDFDENVTKTITKIRDLKRNDTQNEIKGCGMDKVLSRYFDTLTGKTITEKANTGFKTIDDKLMGMYSGQLIGLGARPSCGKSAMAINIAYNNVLRGKTVLFFSMEMEENEIIERIISNKTSIHLSHLINNFNLIDEDKKEICIDRITKAMNDLYDKKLFIYDNTRCTTALIREKALERDNVDLIIIDYLQLMTPIERNQNRNLEIGAITRELKIMSGELHCPILLLSQMNRNKEESSKPSLSDYRDSGNIEQDLTKSMMMWKLNDEGEIGLTINKNRRGATGDLHFQFNGGYMRYQELGEYIEPQHTGRAF